MDNNNLNEALLGDILKRQLLSESEDIIAEKKAKKSEGERHKHKEKKVAKRKKKAQKKQTAHERYLKHKEWREKNPEKVRAQVARHQEKTDQNKNREATRLAKERGDIPENSSCSKCGSKEDVEHHHYKGYDDKDSPTKPLCKKCHNEQPQQNKPGERSVKGGTIKVHKGGKKRRLAASYDRNETPLLEADPGGASERAVKASERGLAQAMAKIGRRKAGKIKKRKFKEKSGPEGILMYPHLDNPKIKVRYTNQDIMHDLEIANAETFNPKELVTIQFRNEHPDWKEVYDDKLAEIEYDVKMFKRAHPDIDEEQELKSRMPEYGPPEYPEHRGQELVGKVLGDTDPQSDSGRIHFRIEGGSKTGTELTIDKKDLVSIEPIRRDGEEHIDDEEYLEKVSKRLQRDGTNSPWMSKIKPQGVLWDPKEDTWDFSSLEETAEEYKERIVPRMIYRDSLYDAKTGKGTYLALERIGGKWRFLTDPRNNMQRIGMVLPASWHQPFDVLDYSEEFGKPMLDLEDDEESIINNLTDPEKIDQTGQFELINGVGTPEEPLEFDASGIRHDLVSVAQKRIEDYDDDVRIDPKDLSELSGELPSPGWWRELFAKQFVDLDSDEKILDYFENEMSQEDKSLIYDKNRHAGRAVNKVIEDIAIANVGDNKWRKWNDSLFQGMWFMKGIAEIDQRLDRIKNRNPDDYEEDPQYQRLINQRKIQDQCSSCRGQKKREDGSLCPSCKGTGSKSKGIPLANEEVKKLRRKKEIELVRAKEQFRTNPELYDEQIKRAIIDMISDSRFKAEASRALNRGLRCEICKGEGEIPIDQPQELDDILQQVREREKRVDQTKYVKSLERHIKHIDEKLQLETSEFNRKSLQKKLDEVKQQLIDFKKAMQEELKELKGRFNEVKSRRKTADKCWACAGKGTPAMRSETRIRGRDRTFEANIQQLNAAIQGAYEGKCPDCNGSGESDKKNLIMKLPGKKKLENIKDDINARIQKNVDSGLKVPKPEQLKARREILIGAVKTNSAKSIAAYTQGAGVKVSIESQRCESCRGFGRLKKHIADGIKGMWAQSFNRIVKDSLPTGGGRDTNLFLQEIIKSTQKYESEFPVEEGVIPGHNYAKVYTTTLPGKEERSFGYRIDPDTGLRSEKSYLKVSDLVDRLTGIERARCPDCYQGIQTKRVRGPKQASEKFLYPSGRRLKLTSLQKEKVTSGERIRVGNEIYSQCQTCEGVGRLSGPNQVWDLEENPIYVERRDDPYDHYQREYSRVLNSLPLQNIDPRDEEEEEEEQRSINPRDVESEKALEKRPEVYLKLRHPALYRHLDLKGRLAKFIEDYEGSSENLEALIEKEMSKNIQKPQPLKNKGVYRIIGVDSQYFQQYGGNLKEKAKKLAREDNLGDDWDDLYVSQDEIEELLDKHNVSRSKTYRAGGVEVDSGEIKKWDSLSDIEKRDWRDRAQRFKKDEYLAKAKARDMAAAHLKWDSRNPELVKRNWEKLPKSRKNYFISLAEEGSLIVGDEEVKKEPGTVTITYENVNSKIVSNVEYRIEFNPTLLQVFPIDELRAQDEERTKKFEPHPEPERPTKSGGGRRTAKGGRGPRGKGSGGRSTEPRSKTREAGAAEKIKRKQAARKRKRDKGEQGDVLGDELLRDGMFAILENMDRNNSDDSFGPEEIARLID